MVFKLLGRQDFSWFYALYLPERWQWSAIIFNVVLGVSLYAIALLIPIRHSRRRWMAEATPSRLWFCT
ncbi:hypothetical protein ACFQX6_42895 [Streptosporangium lutulentum]